MSRKTTIGLRATPRRGAKKAAVDEVNAKKNGGIPAKLKPT